MEKKKYKYPEAQARATKKYIDKNFSKITILIRKENKELFTEYCKQQGKSFNKVLNEYINKTIGKEDGEV